MKAVVLGYYGAANVGDELLAYVTGTWLAEKGVTPVFVSLEPARSKAVFPQWDFIDHSDYRRLARELADADLFVLGGGGVFHDYNDLSIDQLYTFPGSQVSLFAQICLLARQYRVPTIFWAVGVGPLVSKPAQDLVADLFSKADEVSVRDDNSLQILRAIGIDRAIEVAPDPTWSKEFDWGCDAHASADAAGPPLIAVAPRGWPFDTEWPTKLASALGVFADRGWRLRFVNFGGSGDVDSIDVLQSRLGSALIERVDAWGDPLIAGRAFAGARAAVVMRMHAAMLATRAGLPLAAIAYDAKVAAVVRSLGQEDILEVPIDAPAAAYAHAMERLIDISAPRERAGPDAVVRRPGPDVRASVLADLAAGASRQRALLHRFVDAVRAAKPDRRWNAGEFNWLSAWDQGVAAGHGGLLERIETLESQHRVALEHLRQAAEENQQLSAQASHFARERDEEARRGREIERDHYILRSEADFMRWKLRAVERSFSWRLTAPVRRGGHALRWAMAKSPAWLSFPVRSVARRLRRAQHIADTELAGSALTSATPAADRSAADAELRGELQDILERNAGKPIIVLRPLIDWNIPLYQRPQHIALELSRQGFLYFYCTSSSVYDSVRGIRQLGDTCYLTDRFDLVSELSARKVLHVYAGDQAFGVDELDRALREYDTILYEYVDELHTDIAGGSIPRGVIKRHKYAMADSSIVCVATATRLYEEVCRYRSKNMLLSTNGVEFDHFAVRDDAASPPPEIAEFIERDDRPVIGYYGALAKWIDYDALDQLASSRPNYKLLLIGWDYDGSIGRSNLAHHDNVKIVGPIPYQLLPDYARFFDVATIPFLVNDVTRSTSPIKLFEYMALGCPVVSSAIPECTRYRSALIARSGSDFVQKVDEALTLGADRAYLDLLRREALDNVWSAKAQPIADLLRCRLEGSSVPEGLPAIQDEIERFIRREMDPADSWYIKAYRREEHTYWRPVLAWIDGLKDVHAVLDVGPGYGTLLLYAHRKLGARELVGVDALTAYMSRGLIAEYGIRFIHADFERDASVQFDQEFDLVIFSEVLEHLNFQPAPTLARLRRALKPGGHLILTTPDSAEWGKAQSQYGSLAEIPVYAGQDVPWIDGHIWQYSRAELTRLLDEADFEIVDSAYSPGTVGRHLCFLCRRK